ncbi:MAG: helix-turn-helix domain-containing protein [Pelagimonas sp.]|uniref:helix-turn-helix domain-containing protein n=1 Tax=Pelagimonas sp. TaxID=2073170 RepID=UPI003D6B54B7
MTENTENPKDRIRALERGLDVVEHLSRHGQVTLAELRVATGLSNATLFRVLATLRHRGWVRRNIVEGRYELSHSLGNILGEQARAHPLAEFAEPILLDMKSRQAGWPSDLCAVLEVGRLEIVESTRIRGPMAPTQTALGIRPSMVLSAHGRTTLAFSSPTDFDKHISHLRQNGTRAERMWIETGRLDDAIAQTRQSGFALRERHYWAPPFDPGPEVSAMAVPIVTKTGLHGSLSVLWLTDENVLEDLLDQGMLEDLRRSAARIAHALDSERISAPSL